MALRETESGNKTALEIHYTLDRSDLIAFARWARKRRAGNRPWRATVFVVISAIAYGIYFYWNTADKNAALLGVGVLFLVPAVVVPLVLNLIWRGMDKQAAAAIPISAGPVEYTVRLSKANIFHRGAAEETVTPWKTVSEIALMEDYLFILSSGDRGIVVPRKAFGVAGEATRFYEVARSHWQKASKLARPK